MKEKKEGASKKKSLFDRSFYTKFAKGSEESAVGTYRALQNPTIREHYQKVVLQTLKIILITYGFALVFYCLPLHILYYLLGWTSHESLEWGVFLQIAYAVPHIYLIVIQLFGATDSAQLFFGTLERKNSELSSFIKEKKKVSHQSTWEIITRGLFFLFLGVALGFLSLLPTIGYFAYPVGSIITNFATVGPEVAVVFGFLSLIPQINPYCGLLFQVILVTYNTSKNLLRPYTSRSSKEQVDYLNERYFGSLLGFSAPFCLMMYIPIIGMFLYPLSQAACSSLLLNILRRNQGKEKDHMALMGEEFVKPKKID